MNDPASVKHPTAYIQYNLLILEEP